MDLKGSLNKNRNMAAIIVFFAAAIGVPACSFRLE